MENEKAKKLIWLERILKFMASAVIKKYNPRVVGITGSVGKTSSKEAIFSVLNGHYRVRKSEKNYNNEIGLPLTIIGAESGEGSLWRWSLVFWKWLGIMIWPIEYPEVLVLEMGADRPGDIRYITSFVKPDIGVLTDISASHLEYFKTVDGVAKEKAILLRALSEKGLAVMNIDNPKIAKIKEQLRQYEIGAKALTFGFSAEAEIKAEDVVFNYSNIEADGADSDNKELRGLSFKLSYKGAHIPFRLNNVLARHNIYAALAGISVGIGFGLNLVEIGIGIENFSLPCGRMNLLKGFKKSLIIDDSYNSSPVSAIAALEVLKEIKSKRKIVVLGDMLELGKETEEGHRSVAKKFHEIKGDIFIAVGKRMQFAYEELKKHNYAKDRLLAFPSPMEAGIKLKQIIQEGDIVLVKGSQSMRMEKIVEEVMEEAYKAEDYLCRQNETWKKREWKEI